MIYAPVAPPEHEPAEAARRGAARDRRRSRSTARRHELDGARLVLGRSKDCDIQVDDPNVSRRHAEVRQEGATFWLVDLDSTNGIEVTAGG